LIRFDDPAGNRIEVFCKPVLASDPFKSGRPISGFRTGALGMGHVVLNVEEVEPLLPLYRDLVGFKVSDFGLKPYKLYFFHVNGRHHSFAMVGSGRHTLHYFMVELGSLDDVGRATTSRRWKTAASPTRWDATPTITRWPIAVGTRARSHCEYIEGMKRSFLFIATFSLTAGLSIGCCAQERATADTTQMSREEWQAHVKASRERLDLMRREHKSILAPPPSQDEIAEAASRQVLNDTLVPGDIVSTTRLSPISTSNQPADGLARRSLISLTVEIGWRSPTPARRGSGPASAGAITRDAVIRSTGYRPLFGQRDPTGHG
jgi:hypothetical protein